MKLSTLFVLLAALALSAFNTQPHASEVLPQPVIYAAHCIIIFSVGEEKKVAPPNSRGRSGHEIGQFYARIVSPYDGLGHLEAMAEKYTPIYMGLPNAEIRERAQGCIDHMIRQQLQ